MLRMLCVLEVL